jgi:hypothetical protein
MDQNGPLTDTAARELEDRARRRDQKQIASGKSCSVEIQASGAI